MSRSHACMRSVHAYSVLLFTSKIFFFIRARNDQFRCQTTEESLKILPTLKDKSDKTTLT